MQEDNVSLIRRQSGGGAVYHDLGNTNFSFITNIINITNVKQHDRNYDIIINALKKYNINAEVKGRNDIVVANKKISGSIHLDYLQPPFRRAIEFWHMLLEQACWCEFASSEISQTLHDFLKYLNHSNTFCTNLKAQMILA